MSMLVQPGDFCPNTACADYGQAHSTMQCNIIKFGRTRNGQQRYQCRTCRHTFTATKGTVLYRRQTQPLTLSKRWPNWPKAIAPAV